MHRVIHAIALDGYRLQLRFSDGAEGEVDLSDLVGGGVFAAWRDPDFFAQVGIDEVAGTVCWPGGIDLCPDTLYAEIAGQPLPGRRQAFGVG
jgi:hypothetical protein